MEAAKAEETAEAVKDRRLTAAKPPKYSFGEKSRKIDYDLCRLMGGGTEISMRWLHWKANNVSETVAETAAEADSRPPVAVEAKQGRVLIELKHIYKIYRLGGEEVRANDDVSLTICRGEFVAIVGKSGSGKSTLMNIIGALDVPTEGEYYLGGEDVSDMPDKQLAAVRNRMIGFIFQQYNLLPKLNILENVELPLLYAGTGSAERRERAMASLEKVGLKDKWRNFPNQLSGGQQQRVSIARALAGSPSLILADEPTGALDSRTSRDVLNFLKQLNEEGNTIVMITHDNSIAVEAKRVVRIADGKINFDGDVKDYAAIIQARP